MNCHDPQDEFKEFHYTWLLLLIVLVASRIPEDSQFPPYVPDLSEAGKFASLWETKDAAWVTKVNMF